MTKPGVVAAIIALVALFVVIASTSVLDSNHEQRYGELSTPQPSAEATVASDETTDLSTNVSQASQQTEVVADTVVEPMEEVTETVTEAAQSVEQQATETAQAIQEQMTETVTDVVSAVQENVEQATQALASAAGMGDLYSVVDGNKLDGFSYEGFKLYRNWCARCHGTYGQGMVGPNLAESLNIISKDQFVQTVTHGKTGQIGSMPAWESNDTVMAGMDNLYAYLKARADGAIGEVKPAKQN